MRLRLLVAVAAMLGGTLAPAAALAGGGDDRGTPADNTSPEPGRDLGVSVPPEPVVANPGATVTQLVRVTNQGDTGIAVEFHQRAVELGDEGEVKILDEPDPVWGSRVKLPQGVQLVPAEGYQEYQVEFTIPEDAAPDIYLVGFLVTPVIESPGQVKVINEIGSFFTLDVPGKRDWRIEADFDMPSLVFGAKAEGDLVVHNIGRSSLRFWGDITKKISPWGWVDQDRIERLYLPAGKQRSIGVGATPKWGIGIVKVPVRVSYPSGTDGSASKQVLVTKRVIVVHPLWIVALGALVLLLLVYGWRRLRRRRRRRARRQSPRKRGGGGNGRKPPKPKPKPPSPEKIEWKPPEPVSTR